MLEGAIYRTIPYQRHTTFNSAITALHHESHLLATVKRQKLAWIGYATRHGIFSKTSLQCTLESGRRRGRQRKCWMGNIIFRIGKQGPCFTAIEEDGVDKRLAHLELVCEADGVAPPDPV